MRLGRFIFAVCPLAELVPLFIYFMGCRMIDIWNWKGPNIPNLLPVLKRRKPRIRKVMWQ